MGSNTLKQMTGIQHIGLNVPVYASHHTGFAQFTFGTSVAYLSYDICFECQQYSLVCTTINKTLQNAHILKRYWKNQVICMCTLLSVSKIVPVISSVQYLFNHVI